MKISMWIQRSLPFEAFHFFLSFHTETRNGNTGSNEGLGEIEAKESGVLFSPML